MKITSSGQIEWRKRFTLDRVVRTISDVTQTAGDGYLLTGTLSSNDLFAFKIDSSRKVIFATTLINASGKSIFSIAGGGYLLFASSQGTDTLLLKLNSKGNVPSCSLFGSVNLSTSPFGNVAISNLQLPNIDLNLPESSFKVTSTNSQKPVSTVCP